MSDAPKPRKGKSMLAAGAAVAAALAGPAQPMPKVGGEAPVMSREVERLPPELPR
ncbi:hypothetical protein LTR94_027626, partial [Friedmanniomyces endolithicus]